MTLIERILAVAGHWAEARGHRTTARLSTIVANDGGLLKRLSEGGGTTVATLDKFAVFLRDAGNWPEGTIPAAAQAELDQLPPIASMPVEAAA